MRRRRDEFVNVASVLLLLYAVLACTVFAFRHPWATRTECLIYLPTALAFGTVDYCEARPREVR